MRFLGLRRGHFTAAWLASPLDGRIPIRNAKHFVRSDPRSGSPALACLHPRHSAHLCLAQGPAPHERTLNAPPAWSRLRESLCAQRDPGSGTDDRISIAPALEGPRITIPRSSTICVKLSRLADFGCAIALQERARVLWRQTRQSRMAAEERAIRSPHHRPAAPSFSWNPSRMPSGMPMPQ